MQSTFRFRRQQPKLELAKHGEGTTYIIRELIARGVLPPDTRNVDDGYSGGAR